MNHVDKKILLTIDDGPSERAGQLLDYLNAKQIGAILFCCGNNLKDRCDWAVRVIKEKYIIGNHSYNHPHFSDLTEEQAREQIAKTDELIDLIYALAGEPRPAKYFRFPYGDCGSNDETKIINQNLLQEFGYWSPNDDPRRDWCSYISAEDWKVSESNQEEKLEIARSKLASLREGHVLDLHDNRTNVDLRMVERICEYALDLGFTFWTNENLQELAHGRPLFLNPS